MVTVGLIRELNFISELTSSPITADLSISDIVTVKVLISNKIFELYLDEELLWRESLDEETGNFGVESCQRIADIINKKFRKLEYKHLIFKENS